MKKVLTILTLFTAFLTVDAQKVQFGITGDMAFDRTASKAENKAKPDMGWSVGGKVKISSTFGLGIDFGMGFAQADKSYTWYDESKDNPAGERKTEIQGGRLNYLTIPINFRFDLKLPEVNRVFIPYAYAGPEFNWFYDGTKHNGIDVITQEARGIVNEQDAVWNLNFGFGTILFKHFELSYKYTIHLSDCLEIKGDAKQTGKKFESRLSEKTHKVALTLYF